MNPQPNKLMPWLQALSAGAILLIFAVMGLGPMLGWPAADGDMKETEKAIVLILVGFLFGSSIKQPTQAPPPGATLPEDPATPKETK